MPIMYFDIIRGRTREQVRALLDSAQAAFESAWEGVPAGDRYQVVTEHAPDEMIILDHGLGIPRSENIVLLRMISRRGKRTPSQKEKLYQQLVENLQRDCGVAPSDVVATIVDIENEDFTIGYGKMQFCNGQLTH
jgi:Tautomerase enzyme